MEQMIADLGNLAVLTLLADLGDWNKFYFADLDFSVSPFSLAIFDLAISFFHPLNFPLAVPN